MKKSPVLALVLVAITSCYAQPTMPSPPRAMPFRPEPPGPAGEAAKPASNYTIRVEWKAPKEESKFLEILTTEGSFDLNTIQKTSVKINNSDIPVTLKFSGSLTPVDADKARLQFYLGRTVPYVTGNSGFGPGAPSSYSQISVGLNSTFLVHFDKSEVVQSDENGEISVLVKREE